MTFEDKDRDKGRLSQREKYGDKYSEEMARRGRMRKKVGHGGFRDLKLNDPERFAKIIADREAKRKNASQTLQGRESQS